MKNYKNFNLLNENIETIFTTVNSTSNIDGLMTLGMKVNTRDEEGKTLLYYLATMMNKTDLFKHLLNNYNPDINLKYNDDKSIFFYSNIEIQMVLLERPDLDLNDDDFTQCIMFSSWFIIHKILDRYDVDLELKVRKISLIEMIMDDLDNDNTNNNTNNEYDVINLLKSKYKKSYDKYIRNKTAKKFKI